MHLLMSPKNCFKTMDEQLREVRCTLVLDPFILMKFRLDYMYNSFNLSSFFLRNFSFVSFEVVRQ